MRSKHEIKTLFSIRIPNWINNNNKRGDTRFLLPPTPGSDAFIQRLNSYFWLGLLLRRILGTSVKYGDAHTPTRRGGRRRPPSVTHGGGNCCTPTDYWLSDDELLLSLTACLAYSPPFRQPVTGGDILKMFDVHCGATTIITRYQSIHLLPHSCPPNLTRFLGRSNYDRQEH